MNNLSFPKSFPNQKEEQFLKLILCQDQDFLNTWTTWKRTTVFDDIDYSMLRLLPLVYLRLQKLGLQHDELFGRIKGVYKLAWINNQRIINAAHDIVSELDRRNIPVLVLKGIPLILHVYKDMGARFLGDADIVVLPEHAPEVVCMMLDRGWSYSKPWTPDVNNPVASMYQVIKSTDFVNRYGVAMDVHWNIFGLYHHTTALDIIGLKKNLPAIAFREKFWESAVPLDVAEFPAQQLCNEDVLIHVIIHGSEDNIHRTLRWVTDSAAIITTLPIRWDFILKRSQEFKLTVELFVGFRYLYERMNLPIPKSFMDHLQKIPVTRHEIREFYKRAMILGGERFSPWNNLVMFWYAYWRYEPSTSKIKTPFGFIRYVAVSLGVTKSGMFWFIVKKYFKKICRQITSKFSKIVHFS